MIDFRILRQYETSDEQLRQVFTAWDRTKLGKAHKKLRDLIAARIREGWEWSLRQAHHYKAADLLWDGIPILPSQIPLVQFAQGKLSIDECEAQLRTLKCADKFVQTTEKVKDGKKTEVKKINLTKFVETCVQIGRSYISRRLFAQTNRYATNRPFLPFESRFPTAVGRLRAALAGEYVQVMADGYGYAHTQTQYTRGMLLYGHQTIFPECAWDDDRQIEAADDERNEDGKFRTRTKIVREGVPFRPVHPSREFYDTTYPLSSLNTDSGCRWVGYWDVRRFGEVRNDRDFFNRDRVKFSSNFSRLTQTYGAYFSDNSIQEPVILARPNDRSAVRLADVNERKGEGTFYASHDDDEAIMLTDLRMKLVPREHGLGKYPHPLWLRVLVANDDTIVFAEWLPSRPAFVASFNENDDRLLNQGQAHEIMPIQDQVSNILSQLLLVMKHSLLRIIALNTDVLDEDDIKEIEKCLEGSRYYEQPHLLKFSFEKIADILGGSLNLKDAVVNLVEAEAPQDYINNAFKAIVQLLAILERLLMLSPQEQGQPAPREITATETALLEATTSAVYSAISNAIDEARAAQRVIIYESAMTMASNSIMLPVAWTFSRETIEAAGLQVKEDEGELEQQDRVARQTDWTVIGTKRHLVYDYNFTTRDVGDRPTNQAVATTMISLLSQVIPLIGAETLGKKRLFEMINEIARLLGVYSLKLQLGDEEGLAVGEQEVKQMVAQLVPALKQVADENAQHGEQINMLANTLEKTSQGLQRMQQVIAALQPPQPALTAAGGAPTPIVGGR